MGAAAENLMLTDIRYALRNLLRNPAFTAVAVFTLAVAMGVNTAMFSVADAVLLRPLPYRDPGRLVVLWAGIPHLNIEGAFVEYHTFGDFWRARNRSFESLAAYTPVAATLSLGGQPQRIRMLRVSASYFSVIGTAPVLGRDFLAAEDEPGAVRVAVLSSKLWQQRFGGDRTIVGRRIMLDKNSYTVVGVLAPDFDLGPEDVFVPIAQRTARAPDMPSVGVYGRLKPGVPVETAQAEINTLCQDWVRQYHYPQDWGARVWPLHEYLVRDARPGILLLSVAVAFVLLIACANIANLLLARAGVRRREIAIRGAIGANAGRIVRQLLTESAVLGCVAAGVGLLLAWVSIRVLVAADPPLPFAHRVAVNFPVLGFTAAAALVTTILFGFAPALVAARVPLSENLKEGTAAAGESVRHSRFRGALVVAEVALALLLIIGATLTIRSLARLQSVYPGFNPDAVLSAQITLPESDYADPGRRASFFKALHERVAAMPGLQAAGLVSDLPFGGSKSGNDVTVEGAPVPKPGDRTIAFYRTIDPDYFRVLQVRLLRGRFFTLHDTPGPPVAIINDAMARRCWPKQDPIGKRFGSGDHPQAWLTVVGVIGDIRNTSLAEPPDLEYYLPYGMLPSASMSLVVRTALDPQRLAPTLRAAVRELDQDLPLSDIETLSANIAHSTNARRFSAGLLGVFAFVSLLLAAVGVYGVVSYSVARRTHEIGVRVALGAGRSRIMKMVVRQSVLMGALGVAIGVASAFALTRLLRGMLFQVSATDPAVFAAAAGGLLAVCALAGYLPARRAAGVDPLAALRHE